MGMAVSNYNTGCWGVLMTHCVCFCMCVCVCMQMLEAGVGLCNYGYLNHVLESVSTCEFVSV
jgi:hypothetical protein